MRTQGIAQKRPKNKALEDVAAAIADSAPS